MYIDVLCQGPPRPSFRRTLGEALQRKTPAPKTIQHLSQPQTVGSEQCPKFPQQCLFSRNSYGSSRDQQEFSNGLTGKCGGSPGGYAIPPLWLLRHKVADFADLKMNIRTLQHILADFQSPFQKTHFFGEMRLSSGSASSPPLCSGRQHSQ